MSAEGLRNLRISDLCDVWPLAQNPQERVPNVLRNQLDAICAASELNGRPELLEVSEAEHLAATAPYLFAGSDQYVDAETVLQFGETMLRAINTGLLRHREGTNELPWNIIFDGFAHVSAAEPPFAIGQTTFKKVDTVENFEDATQTIEVNGFDRVTIEREWIVLNGPGRWQYSTGALDIRSMSGLPFLATYDADHRHTTDYADDIALRYAHPLSASGHFFIGTQIRSEIPEVVAQKALPTRNDWARRGRRTVETPVAIHLDAMGRAYYLGVDDGNINVPIFRDDVIEPYGISWVARSGKVNEYDSSDALSGEVAFALRSCFTGAMQLMTSQGLVSFAEMADRYRHGESLPAVRSFDVERRTFIDQQPLAVIRHDVMEPIHFLSTRDPDGQLPLNPAAVEVTGNHFLWIRRHGKEFWAQADAVEPNDQLLAADETTPTWRPVHEHIALRSDAEVTRALAAGSLSVYPQRSFAQMAEDSGTGALAVYTLAFERGDQPHNPATHHNFVVCANESTCIVARNKAF